MDIQNKIDFLLERVQKQTPNADVNKIRRAYECANKAHDGQKRKNGDPYIIIFSCPNSVGSSHKAILLR